MPSPRKTDSPPPAKAGKPDFNGGELRCIKGCIAGTPKGCPKTCAQPMTGCCCNIFSLWHGSLAFLIVDVIWVGFWAVTALLTVTVGYGEKDEDSDTLFEAGFTSSTSHNVAYMSWIVFAIVSIMMFIGVIFGVLGILKGDAGRFKRYVWIVCIGTIVCFIASLVMIASLRILYQVLFWLGLVYRWWMFVVCSSQVRALRRGKTGKESPQTLEPLE